VATGDPTWPRVSPQGCQCGLVVSLIRYDTGAAPMRTTQITMEYDLKHPKIANDITEVAHRIRRLGCSPCPGS